MGNAAYRIDKKALESAETNIKNMSRGTPGLKQKMGWTDLGHKPFVKCKHKVNRRDFEATLNAAHLKTV